MKLRSATSDSQDGFFRVAFGNRPDTVLVMSRHKVVELDADVRSKMGLSEHLLVTAFSQNQPLNNAGVPPNFPGFY